MSFWKRKAVQPEPEPELVTFDEWTIVTPTDHGDFTLRGHFGSRSEQEDALRYVNALLAGLRDAGIESELTLTRRVEVKQ